MANVSTDVAQLLNITCRKGDTFLLDMIFTDEGTGTAIDLTDFTFNMQVRKNTRAAELVLDINDSHFAKTIVGAMTITISAADMDVPHGSYKYDIEATSSSDGSVRTWLYGWFNIKEDVTL